MVAIEFCHEIHSFNFLFETIFQEFKYEGFDGKFVENLEPFILSGYFKDELIPTEVLEKICNYYFESRKYHILEKIISWLNFSEYENLDILEAVCATKKLTTTLIHLTITSNQSDINACSEILSKVFECFTSINIHSSLKEIKSLNKKSVDEKYKITSSYEYIGIKILYIIRLFFKGERFPKGKLTEEKLPLYLAQSINFITDTNKAVELVQINARSFFMVASDLFLSKEVSTLLVKLNNDKDARGIPAYSMTQTMVTDKLEEIVNLLTNVKYIRFEFWFFVIKISVSQWYKFKPQAMVKRAYSCIEHVLEEYLEYRNNEESNSKPLVPANEDEIFNGPAALDINDLEQKIIDMLPFYSSFMSTDELEKIVRYSHELKIDKIRIHVYEEKRDFEKCIDVYLHSDG